MQGQMEQNLTAERKKKPPEGGFFFWLFTAYLSYISTSFSRCS